MKTKIELEIDVDKIAADIMEREGSAGYSSITYAVQDEIKKKAVQHIENKILAGIDISKFLTRNGFTGEQQLTEITKKTISEHLNKLTENFIQDWILRNMKWVVEKALRDTLDKMIVPRLQKMIANMLIVDTESQEEEIREMEKALQDQANAAYETGRMQEAEDIRRKI